MANGAYSFNGSNTGISYAHPSAFNGVTALTITGYIWPIASTFYDTVLACIGNITSGAGNNTGFAIYHSGSDHTTLYLAFRSNNSSEKVTNSGVLTAGAWNPFWITYNAGTIRLWINGTEITSWASDSADAPANLGTNNQKLTIGYDEESGSAGQWGNMKVSDPTIRFGVADTNATHITNHAAGSSGLNFVTTGDFCATFRVNQNDENGSRTGTLVGSPTLTTGPTLSYPGGASPQTLTMSLLSATTLLAHSVSPGAVTVTVPLLAAGTMLAPTATAKVTLTSPFLAATTLLAHTLSRGAVTLTMPLMGAGTLLAPTVTSVGGQQTLTMPLLAGVTMLTPSATPGAVTLTTPLMAATTMLQPTLAGRITLTVPLLTALTMLAPTATKGAVTLGVPLLSATTLYVPVLQGGFQLNPEAYIRIPLGPGGVTDALRTLTGLAGGVSERLQ